MTPTFRHRVEVLQFPPKISSVRVGRIIGLHSSGQCLVDFRGNPFGPILAQRSVSFTDDRARAALANQALVLLAFKDDEPSSPIVFDAVEMCERQLAPAGMPGSSIHPDPPVQEQQQPFRTATGSAIVGRICAVRDGAAWVDYEGNQQGPQAARSTIVLRNLEDPVLLLITSDSPVIVGQLYGSVAIETPGSADADVLLQGNSIRITATKEIVLSTGTCEIRLDSAGKATMTGEQVVSRARGANRVQGGCVKLN
jgi:hypothetical protein